MALSWPKEVLSQLHILAACTTILILQTTKLICLIHDANSVADIGFLKGVPENNNPHKNSQKKVVWLLKKAWVKGGGQKMAAMILMLISFNNAQSHN